MFVKILMYMFFSPKAFLKWLVLNFIVAKSLQNFSLKFPLCITNLVRPLIQTSLLLFLVPHLRVFFSTEKKYK